MKIVLGIPGTYEGADDAVGQTIVDKSGDVVIWLISPLGLWLSHVY